MYPSNLADYEWSIIEPLLPEPGSGPGQRGRPVTTTLRTIVNAILYITRTGCQWRALPSDFPHWRTVYEYFNRWDKDGTLDRLHNGLRDQVRESAGRQAEPTAAILDSQSVKPWDRETSGPMMATRRLKAASGILLWMSWVCC